VNPPPRNPYQAPGAALADVERPAGSPIKAVIYGVLVDVGGSIVAGLAIALAYSIVLAASGAPIEEIQRAVTEPAETSWYSIVGFLVGCSASILGGYVCARVAAASEMKPVGIVAAVSGVASLLMGMGAYSFEWNALMALVGMAAVFAGGWAGARRNRRRERR
jgi:hypothetical protein